MWHNIRKTTFYDLLRWYSLLDISLFLEAVLIYLELYQNRGFNLFKMSISLPGISLHWMFETMGDNEKFHLFPPKDSDMGEAIHHNLTGGPSLVVHHCLIKRETVIRYDKANTVCTVVNFDANVFYLWCTA